VTEEERERSQRMNDLIRLRSGRFIERPSEAEEEREPRPDPRTAGLGDAVDPAELDDLDDEED
jgi:hypothetical protein